MKKIKKAKHLKDIAVGTVVLDANGVVCEKQNVNKSIQYGVVLHSWKDFAGLLWDDYSLAFPVKIVLKGKGAVYGQSKL